MTNVLDSARPKKMLLKKTIKKRAGNGVGRRVATSSSIPRKNWGQRKPSAAITKWIQMHLLSISDLESHSASSEMISWSVGWA